MKFTHTMTALCLALALSACGGNSTTQSAASSTQPTASAPQSTTTSNPNLPTLRVATDATYPPFAQQTENGTIEGLDIDLFTAIAANQGFNVQFIPQEWDGIFKSLSNDSVDVIASAVSNTDESVAAADLSDSYYRTPYRVAKLESNTKVNLNDWATQAKIAISSDEDANVDLPERYKVKKEQLLEQASVYLALQALARNEAIVAVADSTVMQYYMGSQTFKNNNIKFTSQALPAGRGADIVFAVKKGNKALLDKINAGLANIKANGEYEKILNKWNQSLPSTADLSK